MKKIVVKKNVPKDIDLKLGNDILYPFYQELKAIFYGPNEEKIVIPGFYKENGVFSIRFSLFSVGDWKYVIQSNIEEFNGLSGEVFCEKNNDENAHGALRVDKSNPHHFIYEDGTHCFMLAYEANWAFALAQEDLELTKLKEFVDQITSYGFNSIVLNVFAYDTDWCKGKTSEYDYGPPKEILWEGTNDNPNYDRMNQSFFNSFDKMMDYFLEKGVIAHVFFKVYNKGVNWPEKLSIQDDLYFKYVVSRYQAYPNIIWDVAKENYNDLDKSYVSNRIHYIRSLDGYRRLLTLHDDREFISLKQERYLCDFLTTQQHTELYSSAIYERERNEWPVLCEEHLYEHGPKGADDLLFGSNASTPEENAHAVYEVVMAGAYSGYYYHYTAWDVIDYTAVPKGYEYMKILTDFFSSIEWWSMEPRTELGSKWICRCLCIPNKEYIYYFAKNQVNHIICAGLKIEEAIWINTLTGERTKEDDLTRGLWKSPFENAGSLLHIRISNED